MTHTAFRQAENAWGARCMGQMFIKKYPEMAILSSDVLNNGKSLNYDVIITKNKKLIPAP